MTVRFIDIEVNPDSPFPYISTSQCDKRAKITADNGRVLRADCIEISITELDFKIIRDDYHWEHCDIVSCMCARRGKLPIELRNEIMSYYDAKTQLKDIDAYEYEYNKKKNLINGIFGMLLTAINHNEIYIDTKGVWRETEGDLQKNLDKYYRSENSFLTYQWGVWVTAHARYQLNIMVQQLKLDCIYCDTDCIKYIGEYNIAKFDQRNKEIMEICHNNDIRMYSERDGKRYYLGIWEQEKGTPYTQFKTLGAKKYVYITQDGKFHATISGVSKKYGANAIKDCDNFYNGKVLDNVHHTTSWYNDILPTTITINGESFLTASNIAILDTPYEIGLTNEYWQTLQSTQNILLLFSKLVDKYGTSW